VICTLPFVTLSLVVSSGPPVLYISYFPTHKYSNSAWLAQVTDFLAMWYRKWSPYDSRRKVVKRLTHQSQQIPFCALWSWRVRSLLNCLCWWTKCFSAEKHVLMSGHIAVIKSTFYFQEDAVLYNIYVLSIWNRKGRNRKVIWMPVRRFKSSGNQFCLNIQRL
jgi:hypothetical protein